MNPQPTRQDPAPAIDVQAAWLKQLDGLANASDILLRRDLLQVRFNLANITAFAACTDAVQLVFKARGGRAIYQDQPLDRCLRDIQTMNQHTFVSLRGYQMAGRALLGMPGDVLMVGTL